MYKEGDFRPLLSKQFLNQILRLTQPQPPQLQHSCIHHHITLTPFNNIVNHNNIIPLHQSNIFLFHFYSCFCEHFHTFLI